MQYSTKDQSHGKVEPSMALGWIHFVAIWVTNKMSSKSTSKPSTFHSVHGSEVMGSGKGCHWDKGTISQEMSADLVVNAADTLLSKKAYTPTVKLVAASS